MPAEKLKTKATITPGLIKKLRAVFPAYSEAELIKMVKESPDQFREVKLAGEATQAARDTRQGRAPTDQRRMTDPQEPLPSNARGAEPLELPRNKTANPPTPFRKGRQKSRIA